MKEERHILRRAYKSLLSYQKKGCHPRSVADPALRRNNMETEPMVLSHPRPPQESGGMLDILYCTCLNQGWVWERNITKMGHCSLNVGPWESMNGTDMRTELCVFLCLSKTWSGRVTADLSNGDFRSRRCIKQSKINQSINKMWWKYIIRI